MTEEKREWGVKKWWIDKMTIKMIMEYRHEKAIAETQRVIWFMQGKKNRVRERGASEWGWEI